MDYFVTLFFIEIATNKKDSAKKENQQQQRRRTVTANNDLDNGANIFNHIALFLLTSFSLSFIWFPLSKLFIQLILIAFRLYLGLCLSQCMYICFTQKDQIIIERLEITQNTHLNWCNCFYVPYGYFGWVVFFFRASSTYDWFIKHSTSMVGRYWR